MRARLLGEHQLEYHRAIAHSEGLVRVPDSASQRAAEFSRHRGDSLCAAPPGRHQGLPRANPFPPSAHKRATAQLVRRFTNSGGRRSVIPTYEWERMLNVIGFYGRHRNEPGFEGWLTQAQPLSTLPSLRELLRLKTSIAPDNDVDEMVDEDVPDDGWPSNDNAHVSHSAAEPA